MKDFYCDNDCWEEMIKDSPKLKRVWYRSLQFEDELDILFIGNSVDDENVGIRTSDEPILSKCPIGEDDVWTEEVKPSLWSFQYNHFVRIERDARKIGAD